MRRRRTFVPGNAISFLENGLEESGADPEAEAEEKESFPADRVDVEIDGEAEAEAVLVSTDATLQAIADLKTETEIAKAGVRAVVIVDGRAPHAVLLELFTEHGAGTLIRAQPRP